MAITALSAYERIIEASVSRLEDLIPESGDMYGNLNWTCEEQDWEKAKREIIDDAIGIAVDAFHKGFQVATEQAVQRAQNYVPPSTDQVKGFLS